jgi:hypothetical protein
VRELLRPRNALLEEALADAVEGAADGFPTPYVAKSLLRIANRPSLLPLYNVQYRTGTI